MSILYIFTSRGFTNPVGIICGITMYKIVVFIDRVTFMDFYFLGM